LFPLQNPNQLFTINSGEVFMDKTKNDRLNHIYLYDKITINNMEERLITKDEFHNLAIKRGTLTQENRDIINDHVVVTYKMLKEVPFPKRFLNIPIIAGSHHKTISGGGYAAKEIKELELTIADKILVIADIFEALSAPDRPYRDPNKLSQIANIFASMVKNKELDKDMVRLFFEDKLYLEYAKEHLAPDQIDEIDIDFSKL